MLIRRVGMQLQFQKQISDKLECEPTRRHTGGHLQRSMSALENDLDTPGPAPWRTSGYGVEVDGRGLKEVGRLGNTFKRFG